MKPDIIIRADGSTSIGMGHVVRCLALADMLRDSFNITFAIQEPDRETLEIIEKSVASVIILPLTADFRQDCTNFLLKVTSDVIIVLDGYNFDDVYQKEIKKKGCKLVYIDDIHAWRQVADVVINHAEGVSLSVYDSEDYVRFFIGSAYALLRKPFLQQSGFARQITGVRKVFISMGAADKDNLTQKFALAVAGAEAVKEIDLMLGPVNPHLNKIRELQASSERVKINIHLNISAGRLKELLCENELAICPASTIAVEACAVGIGLLSGISADNQKDILAGLRLAGVLKDLGDLRQISTATIQKEVKELCEQPDTISSMIADQRRLIDGKSAERLKKLFLELTNEKLSFRLANEDDVMLYFRWANDPVVRENSYQQSDVKPEDHVKWFNSRVKNPDYYFYVFLNRENIPAGQVRITRGTKETIIGISVDEAFRGQSLAVEMIKKACYHFLSRNPDETITAYIKIQNAASYKSFLKAGFREIELTETEGCTSYKLERRQIYE